MEILTPGATLSQLSSQEGELPLTHYRVSLPEKQRRFTLKYSGKIVHDFSQLQESPGRSRQQMRGTISEDGVFLDNGVAWYPLFGDQLQTFSLQVELPDGWLAVSQGDGPETNAERQIRWQASQPQDDIYLIAAPFQLYREQSQGVEAQVYLRQPNAALAQRYLEATHRYLALYSELLGPYPYRKFALVENFWESGYGMPSFTLLGPRVIRLPFIIHTSYPHEILHNWWGKASMWSMPAATGARANQLSGRPRPQGAARQRGRIPPRGAAALCRLCAFRQRLPAQPVPLPPLWGKPSGRLRQEPDAVSHAATQPG
ncbi:M1 family metallopeptidase [endosymbiont of Riftia pachyptila]|uniref:M1 family metallopeptidase n=1 Tax=endosymbiont of Riftia pachyptila TaxID=54396 RepID=UPI00030C7364|nr:M1 family metallopeptidase [endosymbiont of Riftia pachyptila]